MNYSDLRARARENLRGHWGVSVAAAFVAAIFGALVVSSGSSVEITKKLSEEVDLKVLALIAAVGSGLGALSLVRLILGGVIQLGYTKFLLAQHDGREYEVKDLFSQFERFSVGFLQLFLRELYTLLWCLLLVIPGIIKSYSYSMAMYIKLDHPDYTWKECINESKAMMKGHKMELFVLDLSFIGWHLLALVTFGLSYIYVGPYLATTRAGFYRSLAGGQPEAESVNF